MSTAFLKSSKPTVKSEHLIGMRQGRGETLLNTWKRFNGKVIQISNLNHDIAFAALKNGITN